MADAVGLPAADDRSLWVHRDFLRMWVSQIVSSLGTAMSDFVLPLFVLALTGSPAKAGAVAAVEKIPYLVLAIPAGAILDRIDRRKVMVAGNALRSLTLLVAAGYLRVSGSSLLVLIALILVSGSCFVFFDVADNAAFPRLVPVDRLAQASAWMEGSVAVSQLAGPALAGAILGLSAVVATGASVVYGLNGLALLASAVAVFFIRTSLRPPPVAAGAPSLLRSAGEGLSYLARHAELRRLAAANFVNCLLLAAVTLSFITAARQEFHASAGFTGSALALGAVGGILGSLATGSLERRFDARRIMLISGICWALGEAIFSVAPAIGFLVLGFMSISMVRPIYFSILYAHRNKLIPDAVRGRANSMYRMLAQAAEPLGLLASGLALQALGPRPVAVITGVLFLANALLADRGPRVPTSRRDTPVTATGAQA